MRTAITVGWRHGQKSGPDIVSGPTVPIQRQLAEFKRLRGSRSHPTYAKVDVWTSSGGITKSSKFDHPDKKPEIAAPPATPPAAPPPVNPSLGGPPAKTKPPEPPKAPASATDPDAAKVKTRKPTLEEVKAAGYTGAAVEAFLADNPETAAPPATPPATTTGT